MKIDLKISGFRGGHSADVCLYARLTLFAPPLRATSCNVHYSGSI